MHTCAYSSAHAPPRERWGEGGPEELRMKNEEFRILSSVSFRGLRDFGTL